MQIKEEPKKMGSNMMDSDIMDSISKRGLASAAAFGAMADLMKIFGNIYNKETNPDGIISLGVAENSLMHAELTEYFNKTLSVSPLALTYGAGPGGSPELRKALASLYVNKFGSLVDLKPEHIWCSIGVSGTIDILGHAIADEGEAILIGRPIYTGFAHDLYGRNKLKLVPVSLKGVDPMGADAVKLYEKELEKQKNAGVRVRGMILCNPHNPLGKCYTPEVIKAYAKFCNDHQIHFISDEIYALSIYDTKSNTEAAPFTSILAIPGLTDICSPHLMHVLYGMSKDFCANGLRMGALISPWNKPLIPAVAAVGVFEWPSSLADIAWRSLLTDDDYLTWFVKENKKRLGIQYQILVDWFKKNDIPFVENSNAGFFVWVDLRKYLEKVKLPDGDDGQVPGGTNIPGAPKGAQKRDKILWEKFVDAGVYIGTAEMFFGEEHGWYRFSFSTVKEELELGLGRLQKVLKEVEDSGIDVAVEGLKLEEAGKKI